MAKALVFKSTTRHGKIEFLAGVVYGFEGDDAAPYFKALGWASDAPAKAEPVRTFTADEVEIDPEAIVGNAQSPHHRKKVTELPTYG